ncbi:hypothetical protein [Engelhardtia mirabilis]
MVVAVLSCAITACSDSRAGGDAAGGSTLSGGSSTDGAPPNGAARGSASEALSDDGARLGGLGDLPRPAAAAPRILEGTDRDDHLGHALSAPGRIAPGGATILAVGGGTKWEESRAERNLKRDCLALFALGSGAPDLPLLTIEGVRGGDRFAFDLCLAPGLLGDPGLTDLVAGAPRGPVVKLGDEQRPAERGALYIFAAQTLVAGRGGELTSAEADLVLVGPSDGGRLGYSVAAAGDLDGDGIGDLVAGAPGGPLAAADGGRVLLISGARLRALRESGRRRVAVDDAELAARTLCVGAPGDLLGSDVAVVAAGSGHGLIAAGAPQCAWDAEADTFLATGGEGRGYVVVADGSAEGAGAPRRIGGGDPLASFGKAVAWLAPPGRSPLLAVGSPLAAAEAGADSGRVAIHDLDRAEALAVLTGERAEGRFGWSLAASSDGAWLAVGAPNDSIARTGEEAAIGYRRGTVSLVPVPASGVVGERTAFHGQDARDHFGYAVSPQEAPGSFWGGALAWPGEGGTEVGRVYALTADG